MNGLRIVHAGGSVPLYGSEISVPVKGCHRKGGKVEGDSFIETIEVVLHGMPSEINAWLEGVGVVFAGLESGDECWLEVSVDDEIGTQRSRMLEGSVGFLGFGSLDKKRGGLGAQLTIRRENFWLGEVEIVPLSNGYGKDTLLPLRVDGTTDGNHEHWVEISGADITGDLPADCVLRIKNETSGQFLSRIAVGLERSMGLEGGDLVIEGEACLGSSMVGVVIDAGSSGGAYAMGIWDVTSEVEIFRWEISASVIQKMGGRLFKPVLMLASVPGDDYWVRSGSRHGDVLEVSGAVRLEPYQKMVGLPVVHFPSSLLGDSVGAAGDGVFSLFCRRDKSGSHSLAVDTLLLFPLDGYRRYERLGVLGLYPVSILVDDGGRGVSYTEDVGSGTVHKTNAAIGKGFKLVPGKDQRMFFTFDQVSGNWGMDMVVYVQLAYQAKRRTV